MSIALNNLFNFSRPLPPPFDKVTNKKIPVASKYGDGKQATLCCTVIKALNAVCACMSGTGEGAVGVIDYRTVAEYKSSVGPEEFEQKFSEYYDQYAAGFPDVSAATNIMAILCDNVYRRVKDETCKAHIKVTLDKSGNVMRVS